jgi:hypothetical protein
LGYFDVNSPVLDDFEQWFKATFQLSALKWSIEKVAII